jgi:hypothetical protein
LARLFVHTGRPVQDLGRIHFAVTLVQSRRRT